MLTAELVMLFMSDMLMTRIVNDMHRVLVIILCRPV